jgi:hypothetical protein
MSERRDEMLVKGTRVTPTPMDVASYVRERSFQEMRRKACKARGDDTDGSAS